MCKFEKRIVGAPSSVAQQKLRVVVYSAMPNITKCRNSATSRSEQIFNACIKGYAGVNMGVLPVKCDGIAHGLSLDAVVKLANSAL
jgi:hypothetical protein